jgi:hypothetical protein
VKSQILNCARVLARKACPVATSVPLFVLVCAPRSVLNRFPVKSDLYVDIWYISPATCKEKVSVRDFSEIVLLSDFCYLNSLCAIFDRLRPFIILQLILQSTSYFSILSSVKRKDEFIVLCLCPFQLLNNLI